jgi:hypothetical protein
LRLPACQAILLRQPDLLTLASCGHNSFSAGLRHLTLGALDHGRDLFIGVIRIVMKEKQPLCPCSHR